MHSKIIQISSKPIKAEDFANEDTIYFAGEDCFIDEVADYVSNMTEEQQNKFLSNMFNDTRSDISYDPNERSITIIDKEAYFIPRYVYFRKVLQEIIDLDLKDYIKEVGEMELALWRLKNAYRDAYSIYIYDDDGYFNIDTFDTFMRHAKNGDKYYIGSVIDYHC